MAERPFRWGLVGLGGIAQNQIVPGIERLPDQELAAVVSRDQDKADQYAAAHGGGRGLTSYEEMLEGDIDAVYIATPNALHVDQVVAAAAAGKHVLCDKPLALNVADGEKAVEACKSAGVKLGIMFQTRRHGGMPEAAELVRSGKLGRVVMAQVEMSAGRNLPKGWRNDRELAGLGVIYNLGVHGYDVLRYLLGAEVTEVTAMVGSEEGITVDASSTVLLRFDNGTIAYVNANQSVPYAQDDVVLYGTEGRVLARNLSRPSREGTLVVTTADGETQTPAITGDAYKDTLDAFAKAVRAGEDPSPSGVDGLRSVQLTTAIAEAIDTGRTVRVPS